MMRRRLDHLGADDEQVAALHFSTAKVHDDLAQYDDAFEHYRSGNAIKRRQADYDRRKAENVFSSIIDFFDHAAIDSLANRGSNSQVPVLIIGMPRSGTTLVEQVISSHPDAAGAGELAFFPSLAHQLPGLLTSELPFPECVAAIDQGAAETITRNYLDLLRRHSSDALKITDKLPGNYLYVGLFKGLFPQGRVIRCRRDPLDVALSIYFQYFTQGHDYSWDLDDIAHQYGQYERVMQHWMTLFPGSILEVDYDDTINDFEMVARRLIGYCDLPWNDVCLEFHRTRRDVKTASNWQVRQPIYKTSLGRWKHYRHHIETLIETLKPFRGSRDG
jgi:hypothetical protein